MVTLVPFVIALGVLLTVGLAPFVGPFALLVSLVGLLTCVLWKAVADVLALRSESVFRLAKTTELLGRGGRTTPIGCSFPGSGARASKRNRCSGTSHKRNQVGQPSFD